MRRLGAEVAISTTSWLLIPLFGKPLEDGVLQVKVIQQRVGVLRDCFQGVEILTPLLRYMRSLVLWPMRERDRSIGFGCGRWDMRAYLSQIPGRHS